MFQKFRVLKSVDSEGRKVFTYIKNTIDGGGKKLSGQNGDGKWKLPEALEVTVRLP